MMRTEKSERSIALSALAATSGVSLISGRQMVVFFAQFGSVSWLGVMVASALYGVFCALVVDLTEKTGGRSFTAVAMRGLGTAWGRAVGVLYGLILVLVAWGMLAECARLAALMLYAHNASWMGMAFSLGLALVLNLKGMRAWGAGAILLCMVFYLILAVDCRGVQYRQAYETVARLYGSVPAAVLFGAMHAGLSASVSAGAIMAGAGKSPARVGLWASACMLAVLLAANTALWRGGVKILSQAAPDVLLAARWGAAGFYGCIAVKWACCVATLSYTLRGMMGDGRS